MECPFCAETVKDEAIVCKHCSRDLAVVRPIILEIQKLAAELDGLQRKIDRVDSKLALRERPVRLLLTYALCFIGPAILLLLLAHYLIIIQFNLSPLILRIASCIIPIPFGIFAFVVRKIDTVAAAVLGLIIGALAVYGMLLVVGMIDDVSIIPSDFREWREAIEYMASIALAFLTGTILATLVFRILPSTISTYDQPNSFALHAARLLGQHVGKEGLRRRARRIQDMTETAGPVLGVIAAAAGSIYTGLKSVLDI
jgi:hypothetical protein